MANRPVEIIGGGLSGCEAALYLASSGIDVRLTEAKPVWFSAAHSNPEFAEIVCSNSLKSSLPTTASGTLKNELDILGCRLLDIARGCSVPAGSALAVDRDEFARRVTAEVRSSQRIEIVSAVADRIDPDAITIICAGPLCHDALCKAITQITGESALGFYDAAAPIITAESVDMNKAFYGARYGKGGDDYLNCPMNKEEYLAFYDALIGAERIVDEVGGVFEGCMPVEVMASRGVDALRFGPLRPVGFRDYGKPYAVLQLRRENASASLFNLVGFQTNLKFGEQKRVFSMIPALHDIDIVRYGVMHRNTFVDAPKTLDRYLRLKNAQNVFIAGQLSGVEGYVESIATGLIAAINVRRTIDGGAPIVPPPETIIGSLINYITTENRNFQPMNANFGILPPIDGVSKSERKLAYYERSDKAMRIFCDKENIARK